jgi:uncharacterized surface protein with fasciclin (FAS1) repeats
MEAISLVPSNKEDIMKTTFILALGAFLAGGAIFAPAAAGAPEIARQKEERNLIDALAGEPSLGTFHRLVKIAGLDETLRHGGPYTILAPNDAAFRTMPEADLERLLDPVNRNDLLQMLTYHVVPARIELPSISTEEYVTLQGSPIVLNRDGRTVWVGRAEIMKPDIDGGSGGIIHTINMVLEPGSQ